MAITPVPLALLPGLLCDRDLWAPQIEALNGRIDPWVADFTSQDNVAAMARDVLDAMPERFALAGLSMGGYVAFEVLRQAPERVTKLALLDTSARPDTPEQTRRRRGLIQLAQMGQFKGVTPRLLPLLIHEDHLEDQALTQTIMDMAERVGQDAFLGQQKAIMGRPDSRPLLNEISVPTLIVCGHQDALTPPEHAEEMAAAIPEARLEILEDCGHLATLERPEQVNEAFRVWLQRDAVGPDQA